MGGWLKRLELRATKVVTGAFMPELNKQMAMEGLFEENPTGAAAEHLLVEDNGADVTVFSFSGFDVLFAGQARFEFRNAMRGLGERANYVFIRDVLRTGFHAAPDGQNNGPAFYEAEVNRLKAELGATRNIAIGSSSGGTAALWFGARCGMDEAVVFGPALTPYGFMRWPNVSRMLFNFPLLIREPSAYWELVVVIMGAFWATPGVLRRFGEENLMDPLGALRERAESPLQVTYIYGKHSHGDRWHVSLTEGIPGIRFNPLPTGRHNTPAYLKARGELNATLDAALASGSAARQDEA